MAMPASVTAMASSVFHDNCCPNHIQAKRAVNIGASVMNSIPMREPNTM